MIVLAGQLVGRIRIYAGVINRARGRQRRRRYRAVAFVVLAAGAVAVAALTVGGGRSTGGRAHPRSAATTAVRHLTAGRREMTFTMREPAGVILLARISAPRGVRAVVNATIPGLAGVPIGTTPDRFGRNPTCNVRGGMNVCTEAVEWCPMPQATWRLHLTKSAGPAGDVRVDFVVGPQPRSSTAVAR
jgi:hypothetical protein